MNVSSLETTSNVLCDPAMMTIRQSLDAIVSLDPAGPEWNSYVDATWKGRQTLNDRIVWLLRSLGLEPRVILTYGRTAFAFSHSALAAVARRRIRRVTATGAAAVSTFALASAWSAFRT